MLKRFSYLTEIHVIFLKKVDGVKYVEKLFLFNRDTFNFLKSLMERSMLERFPYLIVINVFFLKRLME